MREKDIQSKIRLALSRFRFTMFRQNTGLAWVGDIKHMGTRSVLITNARPLHAGLCVGSSDLIGFRSITITADMVGKKVAVFSAVEVKAKNGRLSKEQKKFLAAVQKAGGIGVVANSDESAIKGAIRWITRMQL